MGYYNEYLEHHGVKGQKWGVRRFQNYDGTRIGGGKSTKTSTKTPKKPKHNFQDKSASDMTARKDVVKSVLAGVGGTAISSAAFAASLGTGQASLAAVSAVYGVFPFASLTVMGTAALVAGDVAAGKANAKEKKFKAERAQNPIDKKTGFHKKTKEMTPEEDMERVNPAYKNWDANTKSNCVLCTMSFELRRRGYDVQAKKATDGYDAEELTPDWFKGARCRQQKGSMSDEEIIYEYNKYGYAKIARDKQKEMIDNTFAEVEKQKDGARGQMTVIWNGVAGGHSIAYANEGGKVVIYDTQANERYEGDSARSYLERCSQVNVTRLDNCELSTKYIKEVAE